jgi:hypothetical protein
MTALVETRRLNTMPIGAEGKWLAQIILSNELNQEDVSGEMALFIHDLAPMVDSPEALNLQSVFGETKPNEKVRQTEYFVTKANDREEMAMIKLKTIGEGARLDYVYQTGFNQTVVRLTHLDNGSWLLNINKNTSRDGKRTKCQKLAFVSNDVYGDSWAKTEVAQLD